MSSRPLVVATFEVNESGVPQYSLDGDKRHYKILVGIKDAPPDTYFATFYLDPETYYDPVRSITPDKTGQIRFTTTAYGDYELKVSLQTREGQVSTGEALAAALRRGSSDMPSNPEVELAIDYISNH